MDGDDGPQTTRPVTQELDALEKTLRAPGGLKDASSMRRYLRVVRESRVRRSELSARCAAALLNGGHVSGDEVWTVLEQGATAALDVGELEFAERCLARLQKQFPKSLRTARLKGMLLEASSKYDAALAVYDEILEKAPTEQRVFKRKAALERSRGQLDAATKVLVEYLDTFMADTEAWLELAELYMLQRMYKQAAFCFEEAMLHTPQNSTVHVKLAECLYTIGGLENVQAARKYFAAAVDLSSGSDLRALYGLSACAAAQAKHEKAPRPKDGAELYTLAATHLVQMYESVAPDKVKYVEAMVGAKAE